MNVLHPSESNPSEITAWFLGRLPAEWTEEDAAAVSVDRDEIIVTVTVATPELGEGAGAIDLSEAEAGRIASYREETRGKRMAIAREAEHRFQRKVAWAVRVGDTTKLFTHLAAPVMTRLRQPERLVLDTLIAANVARSRADALAWCVRLVGQNTDDWLANLRNALDRVDELRAEGPGVS